MSGPGRPSTTNPLERAAHVVHGRGLDHGGEVEAAMLLAAEIQREAPGVVFAEGAFWRYAAPCWRQIDVTDVRRAIHALDGAEIFARGKKPLTLSSRAVDGIARELSTILSDDAFFSVPLAGIPCRSGLIKVSDRGVVEMEPHSPEGRIRFVVDADYDFNTPHEPPSESLVRRIFDGAFRGDNDAAQKEHLIAEVMGVAASGAATRLAQPKAIIFHGASADNGKSTLARLATLLLPDYAISGLAPSDFADERRLVGLAGKALNVADEAGGRSIGSEILKRCITGESVTARDLFKSASRFNPIAQHVFTTNSLPAFSAGLDRGLQRRFIVLPFNRTIPQSEMVAGVAERIAAEEMDVLLGLAVGGLRRVRMSGRFTVPASSEAALREWCRIDPVDDWAATSLQRSATPPSGGWPSTRDLYRHFRQWALDAGFREASLPAPNVFGQRLARIDGVELRRRSDGMKAHGVMCPTYNQW